MRWDAAGIAKESAEETREKEICEIMLPGLNNRVICHFSPFKYDDTIIMSILLSSSFSAPATVQCALNGIKKGRRMVEAEIMM